MATRKSGDIIPISPPLTSRSLSQPPTVSFGARSLRHRGTKAQKRQGFQVASHRRGTKATENPSFDSSLSMVYPEF